jgi:hypothetical protein
MTTKITIFLLALLVLTVPITLVPNASTVFASLAMGNCKELENCEDQKDRVGNDHSNDDDETNDEDADRDGPGGDDGEDQTNDDDTDEQNCWGKVTSDGARTLDPGDFGAHASNPTGDADNDTPREGVGNQNEGHPSDHADTVGGAFSDEDCID